MQFGIYLEMLQSEYICDCVKSFVTVLRVLWLRGHTCQSHIFEIFQTMNFYVSKYYVRIILT